MRDDFMGPDAAEVAEIEREARAAERAEVDAYWAKVEAGELPWQPTRGCEHPYPIAGRCVACARPWVEVSGCRCGLQLGHGGDCQDGGAL